MEFITPGDAEQKERFCGIDTSFRRADVGQEFVVLVHTRDKTHRRKQRENISPEQTDMVGLPIGLQLRSIIVDAGILPGVMQFRAVRCLQDRVPPP